jgi:lambda repressor-like predicted transcriptional regulator
LKAVRAQLILRDSSLSAWAQQNGVKRQNLRKALLGEWQGPKAAKLVERVFNDLLRDAA